jgi:hypothetical protein
MVLLLVMERDNLRGHKAPPPVGTESDTPCLIGCGINVADLNRPRCGFDTRREVSEGNRYKDFGSFKTCGRGAMAKTFLLRGQVAKGDRLA